MKILVRIVLLFVAAVLALSTSISTPPAHAQSPYSLPNTNSGCPASCRQIPWSTGSDLWNGGTLPTYSGATCSPLNENGTTDDSTNLNNCITAANAGTGVYAACHAAGGCAVLLPAGTIYVNGIVRLKSNVVLRGAKLEGGPPFMPTADAAATTIRLGTAGAPITTQNFSSGGGNLSPATSYATFPSFFSLTGTPQKGDTTVTIGSGTVSVGAWIEVYGNDDPTLISTTGSDGHCDWCGNNTGFYAQTQIVQITALTGAGGAGSVATLGQPLYYTPYVTAATVPGSQNSPANQNEPAGAKYTLLTSGFPTQKAGLENLRFDASLHDIGANQIILLDGCLYCWVKGNETYMTGSSSGSAHVEMDYSYGDEVRDNALHDQRSGASGSGYGVYFQFVNSNHKVENNIIYHNRHWVVYQGGGSGTAILYNYTDDGYTDDLTYFASGRTSHGGHPFFNLFEGNITQHIAADDFWGSSSHDVFFRNWIRGGEPNIIYSGGTGIPSFPPNNGFEAVNLYTGQSYYSYVNNVLGNPGLGAGISGTWSSAATTGTCTSTSGGNTSCDEAPPATPIVYETGGALTIGGLANVESSTASIIRQANYDYKTLGVAFNDGGNCGSSCTYQASYYYATKPAFIGSCPWPAEGSDLSPVSSLSQPAYQRAMGLTACTGGSGVTVLAPTNLKGTVTIN